MQRHFHSVDWDGAHLCTWHSLERDAQREIRPVWQRPKELQLRRLISLQQLNHDGEGLAGEEARGQQVRRGTDER
jgi:hypothetical protein